VKTITSTPPPGARDPRAVKRANVRTALVLLSVAIVFFIGIISAKFIGGFSEGVSLMGILVLLFLCVAIGRNLFSRS
jgi:hypothetical protein